jgi:antitoxin component YwqK of YwqJK toxin-antitoxin module
LIILKTKTKLTFLILTLIIVSCGRTVDPGEIVWNDYVFEKNGIYYKVNCATHSNYKRYSGTDTVYFDKNKIKAISIIEDGVPIGHWVLYNTNGTKKIDMYYENGKLLKKVIHKKAPSP